MEALGFYVCDVDLEDELIRALGTAAVEAIVDAQGELGTFRTFQHQPAQRGRPAEAQLRRFMGTASGRKIELRAPARRRVGPVTRATAARLVSSPTSRTAKSEVEQLIQADREARGLADLAYREQHAGHERGAVVAVVADDEALAGRAEQHLLVGDQPAHANRVHRDLARRVPPRAPSALTVRVGSSPQSFDAPAMRCAVSIAVPEGASAFWSWCSSMISPLSKYGDASSANRIINTAPMAKFGAITAFADERSKSCANSRNSCR